MSKINPVSRAPVGAPFETSRRRSRAALLVPPQFCVNRLSSVRFTVSAFTVVGEYRLGSAPSERDPVAPFSGGGRRVPVGEAGLLGRAISERKRARRLFSCMPFSADSQGLWHGRFLPKSARLAARPCAGFRAAFDNPASLRPPMLRSLPCGVERRPQPVAM